MSLLQQFLNANPIDGLTDEVVISDRFRDPEGNLLKFKIKAMTGPEFEAIRKASMIVDVKNRKSQRVDLNMERFNSLIVINHTIDPNFKDAESIKMVGATTPEEYLAKVLLPGEIAQLSQEIQRLSGFDQDLEELVEEAKN